VEDFIFRALLAAIGISIIAGSLDVRCWIEVEGKEKKENQNKKQKKKKKKKKK
jgi:hypothetical protein